MRPDLRRSGLITDVKCDSGGVRDAHEIRAGSLGMELISQ